MKSFVDYYNTNKSRIEQLYAATSHWHGTGRFHYDEQEKIIDVLRSIIDADGLKPLVEDPWLPIEGKLQKTISLAKIRMYARIYAELHQFQGNKLEYSHKSSKFWFWAIGLRQMLAAPLQIPTHLLKLNFQKDSEQQLNKLFTKYIKKSSIPSSGFLLRLLNPPFSDIVGNYGVIFGIKKDTVSPLKIDQRYELYEDRTNREIPISSFSYIEVPWNSFEETQRLLDGSSVTIPLLPIEAMELHLSQVKIKALLTPVDRY